MRIFTLSIFFVTLISSAVQAQSRLKIATGGVSVSDTGQEVPDPSAVMDVSAVLKGFLFPRLSTTQRNQIPAPAEGLTIYNLTTHCINVFNGSAWIDLCAPGALISIVAPASLEATPVSSFQINLTWADNSDNEEGFEVWYKNASETEYVLYATTAAGAVTQSITGLEEETEYDFRVRAVALSVSSVWSNEASAITHPYIEAPTGLVATTVSISQIDLAWADNSDNELGFDVWYKKTTDPDFIFYGSAAANTTSLEVTGLEDGTEYTFMVRGVIWPFYGEWSSEGNATTYPYIAAPGTLVATAGSSSQIDLTWTDNSDNEDGFEIWYKLVSEQEFALYTTSAANTYSQSVVDLTAATEYIFKVRAILAIHYSDWSNTADEETLAIEPPIAPSALAAQTISNSEVRLNWMDNSDDESGFEVYISEQSGSGFSLVGSVDANTQEYLVTGLIEEVTYYFKVRATGVVSSNYSNEVSKQITYGLVITSQTSAADNNWTAVAYGNGVFVAIANTGSGNRAMTSPDGITWTLRLTPLDIGWIELVFANGLFVAVSNTATGNKVMTSSDGIAWTLRSSSAFVTWSGITYGNGLFVAVATGTGPNRIMTSPDGINWTTRTSPNDNSWAKVAYGNGVFVAVSFTGTGNRVMTSPDGITWTPRSSAADYGWTGLTYGEGLFVAVSNGSVMTSPDGINWSLQPVPANAWRRVAYGNGLFVAVSGNGIGNRVMFSSDGINWAYGATPADNSWFGVTYGNGKFVIVGNSGTGNRVMTGEIVFQ